MTPIVATTDAKRHDGNTAHEFGAFSLRQEHWHDKAKQFNSRTWRVVKDWAVQQFQLAISFSQFRIARLIWNPASGSGALTGMKTITIRDKYQNVDRTLIDIRDEDTVKLMRTEEQAFFKEFGELVDVREFGIGILNENNFAGNDCPFSAADIRRYYEMMYSIWGRKLSMCVGGQLGGYTDSKTGKWVPPTPLALFFQMFREGGPLYDKRPQAAFQDSYGTSNWDSQYKIAEMHLGYWPTIMVCEVEGIANQWVKLGRNVAALLKEFEAKYQFLRNMGSWPSYEGADAMVERMKAKVAAAVAAFRSWVAGDPGTPEQPDDSEQPPAGEESPVPVSVRVQGGFIRDVDTIPAEHTRWFDAAGKSAYTFTSEHTARVDLQAARQGTLDNSEGFLRWEVSGPAHNLDVLDKPDGSFRTEGRGTDITVKAIYEGAPIDNPTPDPPTEFVTKEELAEVIGPLLSDIEALKRGKADRDHGHQADVTVNLS